MRSYAQIHVARHSPPDRLAALAGVAAAIASLVGFIPGVYRDWPLIVAQSHGYDVGNLLAVGALGLGLVWVSRGSVRGRLLAIGALGCLMYAYVTYAFVIILNPATLLYIAVLGFGGWSLIIGFASVDAEEVETALGDRLPRRATAVFLIVAAFLFAVNWLNQMAQSAFSGQLPAEVAAAGWPMNPVYVLDLGFMIPLSLLTGASLIRGRPIGARFAVPLLVFLALLAANILMMAIAQAIDGQELQPPMIAIFVVIASVSSALAGLALRGRSRSAASTNSNVATGPRRTLRTP